MADLVDQAQQQAAPLNTTDHRRPEGPKATGQCLNCETPQPPGQRWCDWECKQDYDLRMSGQTGSGACLVFAETGCVRLAERGRVLVKASRPRETLGLDQKPGHQPEHL